MANRWSVWRAELERISPFSADWNEGEPEDFIRVLEEIAARKREIESILQQASQRQLSEDDRAIVERVRSFLQLSDQAAGREDMRQAEALSERALVLARELRRAR